MRARVVLALVVAFFVLVTISIVFHSTDPGIRGILADTGFFGSILVLMFLIVTGGRALARRYRRN